MSITNLKFNGISRAVSDINTSDGGTAELINAVVENDEIRPAPLSLDPTFDFGIPGRLLGIHSLAEGDEVIISEHLGDDGWYLHFDLIVEQGYAEPERVSSILLPREVKGSGSVNTLGNVVVYSCLQGAYYIIYKEGGYLYLGERPPFPKLAFSMDSIESYSSDIKSWLFNHEVGAISLEDHRTINTTAQALINKFLSDCREKNSFVFPFFVRYALRMADGTHILHSAPILMNPSTEPIPFAVLTEMNITGPTASGTVNLAMKLAGYSCFLRYRGISKSNEVSLLSNWADIITHIDIFVSAPIYSYKELTPDFNSGSGNKVELDNLVESRDSYGFAATRAGLISAKNTTNPDGVSELKLPVYSVDEQYENVVNTSLFYLVHSLPLSEFMDAPDFGWTDVPMKEGTLESLVNRPALRDDFNSHVGKSGSTSEVYNQRLTLADMSFKAFSGYPLSTMRPMVHTDKNLAGGKTMTVLQKGASRIVVESEVEDLSSFAFTGIASQAYGFHYYPDSDAKEMYVSALNINGVESPRRLGLTPHSSLNGAYCFLGYPSTGLVVGNGNANWPSTTSANTYSNVSEVYQSQVGNPFHFPLNGITSIGNTRLIAIVASSIEVSTGQMGDFPMYAFCEDGVWILSISPEGWISTPQLISNDVCLGKSAIVALNRPIIFATARGLMLLEGSKITSLSDGLLGPRMDVAHIAEDITSFPEYYRALCSAISQESFIDFLAGGSSGITAFLVYDNPNNRVLILHPAKTYAYVLTLSNFTFSKTVLPMDIGHAVSHYSGVYFQSATADVDDADRRRMCRLNKDVDTDGDTSLTPIVAISRPIKFGEMNLKSIKRLLVRHDCSDGVKTVLYGSRDGVNYCGITSLRGRPYRYFILALFATMAQSERIATVSIDWDRKFTNKLR